MFLIGLKSGGNLFPYLRIEKMLLEVTKSITNTNILNNEKTFRTEFVRPNSQFTVQINFVC